MNLADGSSRVAITIEPDLDGVVPVGDWRWEWDARRGRTALQAGDLMID